MKFKSKIGISAYGAYLPKTVILAKEIELAQGKNVGSVAKSLGIEQKTVPEIDEDSATMAVAAGKQALDRLVDFKSEIGALFIGSESHPYAVKPTGTVVAQALGLPETLAMADLQFACKAGTQALQIISAYLAGGMIEYGLAIGSDTAQARPGDALEFSAAAGSAAFVLGKEKLLAKLLATVSVATDTPDFWRKPGQAYPQHAGRFTGEPAYFYHVLTATKLLLAQEKLDISQIGQVIFHTPNGKFPLAAARKLGVRPEQMSHSLVVGQIGNTYAAASLLALVSVLDHARAGEKILLTSYGSGAGADSFLFQTTSQLPKQRKVWKNLLSDQIASLKKITYLDYQHRLSQRGSE